ncbi:hypothetical protein NP233_g5779 [Leucocoprinus birnbaumii]|uniref:Nephrocystin 3-like N-terminal domain-containing protein n=1 Tax=Leucocoprinus birnbaumii TaxID=56174 RepID=A0AAD5VS82_9AGAR|nr:hypothetical protein NP233_g5779 [Leucocoprinus birnbaumii]
MFDRAQNFIISNSCFTQVLDNSRAGSGLDVLLSKSMPDAFHDSGARYPPPKCHYGTRMDYIEQITDWALNTSDHKEPVLWMHGPFGVGKTAVAQTCAEALERKKKLIATLFFSRSNTGRDDPQSVFPSITYQVATSCEAFSDIIEARIRKNPALTTKALPIQFEELLVSPLRQMATKGSMDNGIEGGAVIIDGLDECRGTREQCEIIRIIAASAQDRTTPFRWFITSRPEDHIIRTMNSTSFSSILARLELPVSREIDHEILIYLTDELEKLREQHELPHSWVSERDIALLVERAAGLWIYATTMARFIDDVNSLGPQDQLRIVLKFAEDTTRRPKTSNPLKEMDSFYALIMEQIPSNARLMVRRILLLHLNMHHSFPLREIAVTLRLSMDQTLRFCRTIQSVAWVEYFPGGTLARRLRFHHASFLDFLKDRKRSGRLHICGKLMIDLRKELLEFLHMVCAFSADSPSIKLPSHIHISEDIDPNDLYRAIVERFFSLCVLYPLDHVTATSLAQLPFRKLLELQQPIRQPFILFPRQLVSMLPDDLSDKILRQDKCLTPGCPNVEAWIWGHGENETPAFMPKDAHSIVLYNQWLSYSGNYCTCGELSANNTPHKSTNSEEVKKSDDAVETRVSNPPR